MLPRSGVLRQKNKDELKRMIVIGRTEKLPIGGEGVERTLLSGFDLNFLNKLSLSSGSDILPKVLNKKIQNSQMSPRSRR